MSKAEKKHTWALKLFISIYLMSKLFTIMHWPFVPHLSMLSALVLVIFYPLRYLAKPNKVMLDHVKMAWILTYAVQALFQLQHYMPLSVFQTILFLFWFLNEGFFYFDINLRPNKNVEKELDILDDFSEDENPNRSPIWVDAILLLSGILVLASALFNVMHWPFSSEMMIIGYTMFAIIIWFKKF